MYEKRGTEDHEQSTALVSIVEPLYGGHIQTKEIGLNGGILHSEVT